MSFFPSTATHRPAGQLDLASRLRARMIDVGSVAANSLFGPVRPDSFGILMYHRLTNAVSGHPAPTWNVSPAHFEAQLRGLLRRGFEPWPLRKVLEFKQHEQVIPRNVFVVTCDDGYSNFYHHALPILQRYQVPATLFIVTSYLDSTQPFPFDDWTSSGREDVPRESWLPLTTDECRKILHSGLVELGAHTHTHQDFRNQPAHFAADMRECLAEMRSRFGVESPTFAFPFGYASDELIDIARSSGVTCSVTTDSKVVSPTEDPFHWGRFTAHNHDTSATLAARLNGWNNFFRCCFGGVATVARCARGRWRK